MQYVNMTPRCVLLLLLIVSCVGALAGPKIHGTPVIGNRGPSYGQPPGVTEHQDSFVFPTEAPVQTETRYTAKHENVTTAPPRPRECKVPPLPLPATRVSMDMYPNGSLWIHCPKGHIIQSNGSDLPLQPPTRHLAINCRPDGTWHITVSSLTCVPSVPTSKHIVPYPTDESVTSATEVDVGTRIGVLPRSTDEDESGLPRVGILVGTVFGLLAMVGALALFAWVRGTERANVCWTSSHPKHLEPHYSEDDLSVSDVPPGMRVSPRPLESLEDPPYSEEEFAEHAQEIRGKLEILAQEAILEEEEHLADKPEVTIIIPP